MAIYDFWIFKVPFFLYFILKKSQDYRFFKSYIQFLKGIKKGRQINIQISKVKNESVSLSKNPKVVKQTNFEKKNDETDQNPNNLFKIWLNLFKIPQKIVKS